MKIVKFSILGFTLALTFFAMIQERYIKQASFGTGEHLEFRVRYGFISAAEALVSIDPNIQFVNKRPCYKVEVVGKTVGAFDFISRVRDTWRTHIDTSSILPQQFYEKKQEKDYKKEELVNFDHINNTVSYTEISDPNAEKKSLKVPNNVQDLISSYFYIRTLDFNAMKEGEVVGAKVYYDDEIMDMKMKFKGRENVDTKFGRVSSFRISPVVPNNRFFSGKDPIKIWVSDDSNHVPLKVEVSLTIGSLVIDLKKYSGLKSELNLVKVE